MFVKTCGYREPIRKHHNNNLFDKQINDIHIIKPPSINFCNMLLIANISIISINTITKDSV